MPRPRTEPRPRHAKPSRRDRALFEIQVHPGDIRRRVRYLFFGPRQLLVWGLAIAGWTALVVAGAAMAPDAVGGLRARSRMAALEAERERQADRLKALAERLVELEDRSEDLKLRVDKARLAYGLYGEESIGQGGFPAEPEPVPRSQYSNVIAGGRLVEARVRDQLHVLGVFLDEVQEVERARGELVRLTPSITPLRGGLLTSPFGDRISPFTKKRDFHVGIDLAAPIGKPIVAPADGVVVFAGRYPLRRSVAWWRYGNLVVVRHGEDFITLYAHCDEIEVRRGERVSQGDVIATVGESGLSTNPHLHYEVRRRDEDGSYRPVDPRIYILDHRWSDEERILVRARSAPPLDDYEPLPRLLGR